MKITLLRKNIQGITLVCFLVLFFLTYYPFPNWIPVDFFLRLDPLVALITMFGARVLIPTMLLASIVIVLSFLFGRFFCGYICPLGTIIDGVNTVFFKKKGKSETPEPKPLRKIKYFILIALIAASLLGADLLHFFSPFSILPRSLTLLIYPPITGILNVLIDVGRPLFDSLGLHKLSQFSLRPILFINTLSTLFIFSIIIGANYWRKRFWCRYICPTGALISIFSRFGIMKRITHQPECNSCKRCMRVCDMHAIDTDPTKTILSECTLCGNCVDTCARNGVSIRATGLNFSGQISTINTKRREFISTAFAGIAAASITKTGIHNQRNIEGRFIRPPGSKPENEFLSRCIRCGECMKVCQTNGLQPSGFVNGIDTFLTPLLIPRYGPCEEKCNMCGTVCPTQAIRTLPLEEKQYVKIGTAVIDRHRCVAWEQDKLCLICDEICPYNAIEFKIITTYTSTFKRPFVIAEKCTGCGWCENRCPTFGRGAIEVYSIGEDRIAHGSYITDKRKAQRFEKENSEDSYSVDALGSGGENSHQNTKEKQRSEPSNNQKTGTPPPEEIPGGFIIDNKK